MKICVTILLVAMVVGCLKDELPPGYWLGGFKLADEQKHSRVIEIFDEREIPHRESDRGLTRYRLQDQAEALGIIRYVLYDGEINENRFESLVLMDEEEKNMYMLKFNSESIPFEIRSSDNGLEHIFWSQRYGYKVDQIRQEINIERRQKERENRNDLSP